MSDRLRELWKYVATAPLRRGKGRLGGAKLSLRLFWRAILSWCVQRRDGDAARQCDVLLIHPSRKSFLQGRKKPLITALQARGMRVEEHVEESDRELLRQRQFAPPGRPVPFLLYWHAAHAAYLLQRYRPKVILSERNAWIVPSFIKTLRAEGAQIMHLAHSVPSGQSSRYDYFDYDYYLMFGRSSFEYLSSLHGAYGTCRAVFAGPYYLSDSQPFLASPGNESGVLRLLFLGSGPDYEHEAGYQQYCSWVMKWLRDRSDVELAVKVHPRGSGHPWVAHAAVDARVRILPQEVRLEECAQRFDLVLSGYTNAVLDVARAGTPFVLLGSDDDYFSVESFGLPRCRVESQLAYCIESVVKAPGDYKLRLAEFLKFHIDQPDRPMTSLVDCVEKIVGGHVLPGRELSAE